MKKVIAMLLVLMLATTMVGCKKETDTKDTTPTTDTTTTDETTPEATTAPAEEEWVLGRDPLEFSFYVNYDWYSPKGFGSTEATKWLQEYMNVTVTEISSNGQANQKFGTMVSTGELPDVIQLDKGAQYQSLVEANYLVAIDDFMNDAKTPNYKAAVDPQALAMGSRINDKNYGILNWFGNPNNPSVGGNKGFIVNKKIYKELGSPSLETFGDLYAYLKLVKETYTDVVPLDTSNTNGGTVQVQNFLYVGAAENHFHDWGKSDGNFSIANFDTKEFTSIFEDAAFKLSYQETNKYFREGLLTQDAFTQSTEQFKEKLNNGKIAVAGIYDAPRHGDDANQLLGDENGYMVIPYPHAEGVNPDNIVVEGQGDTGWNINCITTTAEHPERIYAFFDWLCSEEGTIFMQFGPQGELWDELNEEGSPIANEKFKAMSEEEKSALKIGDFNPQGSWIYEVVMNKRAMQDPAKVTFNTSASAFFGSYVEIIGNELENTGNYPAESDESTIWTNIKTLNEEYVAKLVYAKSDAEFDTIFTEWKQRVADAGYQKLLDFRNAVWKSNLEIINQ